MAGPPPGLNRQVYYEHSSGVDEILRPTVAVIDGRRYRKVTEVTFGRREGGGGGGGGGERLRERRDGEEGRGKVPLFVDDVYDEGEESTLKGVESTAGGGYRLKLPVPSAFFKYIIGREGRTKANIERETGCRLGIPGFGREGDIIIEGPTVSSVGKAKQRLEVIMWSNRSKEPPTHFISIPLNHPLLMERLLAFKKTVLKQFGEDRGIIPEVFQLPEKLHITVGVMRLFSIEEEERAKDTIRQCLLDAVSQLEIEPAVIVLRRVECMGDDPGGVRVLYAKVHLTDGSNRLQRFVDSLYTQFLKRAPDLMEREHDRDGVKLHATIMNAKFPGLVHKQRSQDVRMQVASHHNGRRQLFDARRIFKELADFDFGEVVLDCIHLSKRKEYGPNGFYKCIEEFDVKLDSN